MKASTTMGFVALVALFGLPVVFPEVAQIALTQAMIVVVGWMVAVSDD